MAATTGTGCLPVAPQLRADLLAAGVGATLIVGLAWAAVAFPSLFNVEGAASPRGLLVLSAGLALGLLFLHAPALALCGLVAFVYLNLSEVLVRKHHVPSLLQVSFVPLALAAAWNARVGGALPPRTLTLLLGAALGALSLSTVVAADQRVADWRVLEHLKGFAVYLVVVMLMPSGNALRRGAWALAGSAGCLGGLALVQLLLGDFTADFGGLARVKQAHIYGHTFEPRIAGPLGDPNFFAQILVIALPFALSLAWSGASRRGRILAATLAAAIGTACLFTYSRGGALALVAVLSLTALFRGADLRKLSLAALLLVPLLSLALPAHFADRLTTLGQLLPGGEEALRPDSSFQERKVFAAVAWHIFTDRPLVGVGAGNYATHFLDYTERVGSDARLYVTPEEGYYPHNLYLEIASETGVLGLVAFGAVFVTCLSSLSAARRSLAAAGDHASADLAAACAIGLTGYLLTSVFLHGHFIRYLWLLFGFVGAIHNLAIARVQTPPAGAPVARTNAASTPDAHATEDMSAAPDRHGLVRPAIAVVVSRFPSVTETFILREIVEMERQGQPVRLVPLIRESPPVVHREARPWVPRALYVPFVSAGVAAANLRMFGRRPARYVRAFARVALGTLPSPNFFVRSLALFPKSVCLAERLEREGIRHLHAHFASHPATVAWIVSMLTDARFSITVHAHDIFVRRTCLRPKLQAAAFIRAISQFNRDYLVRRYPEVAAKTVVVHVGLDPAPYEAPRRPTEPGSRPRLLCVAALQPYKGLPVLVEACRLLRDRGREFECDLVGHGHMQDEIGQRIREAGLEQRVRLLGARTQNTVAALMREAALLVQPSIVARDGQMEGIPVAIMEGMATGLPVVASALSGIPEAVLHRRTGLLVEPGDARQLAAAIDEVLSDPAVAHQMGERGREVIRREFRLDACVGALLRHLDECQPSSPDVPFGALPGVQRQSRDHALGLRHVYDGRDARVLHVISPAANRQLEWVVKVHKSRPGESRPAEERARREYEVLCRLAGAEDKGCQVPRPLRFDAAAASVVMEPCRGERLDALIRTARRSPARVDLTAALRRTGAWLRQFHDATAEAVDARVVIDRLLADARRDLEVCSRRDLSASGAAGVWSQVLALEGQLDPASVRVTGVHRDFWPGNIFVDDDTVQVIDFEGVAPGLPFEDIGYFLVQLELFFWDPLTRRRFDRLPAVFLQGYLAQTEAFDWAAYELCRVAAALRVLAVTPPPENLLHQGARRRRRVLRGIIEGGVS
jgi:glycosyltransferase involved in cell wall biosynthesis/O-antigen ligase/aminoglycoside phosphotransferase (APT) family kinase protein